MMSLPNKIILAGFMGTGKTSVGKALAKDLGFTFIDTDQQIEAQVGKPISQIFSERGEDTFRALEGDAIDKALKFPKVVIAVGGGAVCRAKNFHKLKKNGWIILLVANLKTILQRISKENHRPLLERGDKEQKISELLKLRQKQYAKIETQISTDQKSVSQIVREIRQLLPLEVNKLKVQLGDRTYPLYFQNGGIEVLPLLLERHCPSKKIVLVTDKVVNRLYGKNFFRILKKNFQVHYVVLPSGEKFKNLKTVEMLYEQLVKSKADRKTTLVALGGGVIGDVVGFAAATYLRGIPFVQIPTTLLAQVDSSIGGKTGVDLKAGKNLVGAFYQPKFVLIDEQFLLTLSLREFVCGMAEVIKYAAIFDAKLFQTLEDQMDKILSGRGKGMEAIVRRCCELKAWVVERDEKETLGLRSLLNFGHTLGHAIESLTQYKKFNHGEAIAMGMVFAAQKSVEKCNFPVPQAEKLKKLIERAGLPTGFPSFKKSQYHQALAQDKKRVSSVIHFVYLIKIGKAIVFPVSMEEIVSGV